ncbi:MAG: Na+/H+ antiporter NhaA [Pseudomonadota bacterium]
MDAPRQHPAGNRGSGLVGTGALGYRPLNAYPFALGVSVTMYRVSPFVRHFAWALLGGVGLATLWVNISPASYYDTIEWRLADMPVPLWLAPAPFSLTPMSIVSDGLMALFLFFVGKELWESLVLERGALAQRRAILPGGAVLGGVLGAVVVWWLAAALFETAQEATPGAGWPVPVGSDVVLCYVFGRHAFGRNHPALHLLLLITIASDIVGLVLLGLAYPATGLRLVWLLLPLGASVGVWALFGRIDRRATELQRQRSMALWPYVLAGLASYIGVAAAGLPPALGLLPVIPAIPHADRAFGLFAEAEEFLHDPLNRLAHLLVRPLGVVLFLFGLTRGGIDLGALAPTTGIVLAALWIGKPVGLMAGVLSIAAATRMPLPAGLSLRDLVVLSLIAGIGFTVPVLAIDTALPGGAMTEAARLGLGLSLLIGPFALLIARFLPR